MSDSVDWAVSERFCSRAALTVGGAIKLNKGGGEGVEAG